MAGLVWLIVLLIVVAVVSKSLKGNTQGPSVETPRSRRLLTKNEQPMYFRLRAAFPEHVILAQVSFSALVTVRSHAVRNRFNRKVADFVVCNRAFEVLAVVELDDASHKGKETTDRERDSMLISAGYKVLRYARVPDIEQLQRDLSPPPLRAEARSSMA